MGFVPSSIDTHEGVLHEDTNVNLLSCAKIFRSSNDVVLLPFDGEDSNTPGARMVNSHKSIA